MTKLLPNSTEPAIAYREMTLADIPAGLQLCRASRWNQLERDWELFLKLNPHGCRVAVNDEQVVGTVATLRFQRRFSWISMVLVDPGARGQGVGTQLLYEALDILRDMKTIRLDATPAGHAIYRKLDFADEYWLSRMETTAPRIALPIGNNSAQPMTPADLPEVLKHDREVFGADRQVLLEWTLTGAPEYAWIIRRAGRLAGYTFGRHGFAFEHIGPVIAHDQEAAQHLVMACLAGRHGRPFILDASRYAPDWLSWLESLGFTEQRPFIRMFRGENKHPGLPDKQFAILGPEFG
ncbi:MAG: GNAT family N-acetyltransferase [Acidobacteriota bacterium]|nr:GNAT family N-acetyltransferase [Acidobacteriota bacterium]